MNKLCPKCQKPVSEDATDCLNCGICFSGYQRYLEHHHKPSILPAQRHPHAEFAQGQLSFLEPATSVRVQQNEGLFRIVTGWQTRNRYVVFGANDKPIAYIAERDKGFLSSLSRQFFGPRRPLTIDIFNPAGEVIAQVERPWFWFLSTLSVRDCLSQYLGSIQHRFSLLNPRYELRDHFEQSYSYLESSFLGGATLVDSLAGNRVFNAFTPTGDANGGSISRVWKGLINRSLTAEDTYQVDFSREWSAEQKLICLAASITIDLDFYEEEKGLINRFLELSPWGILFGRSGSSSNSGSDGGNI